MGKNILKITNQLKIPARTEKEVSGYVENVNVIYKPPVDSVLDRECYHSIKRLVIYYTSVGPPVTESHTPRTACLTVLEEAVAWLLVCD